jgi:HAMP domain-containing protein
MLFFILVVAIALIWFQGTWLLRHMAAVGLLPKTEVGHHLRILHLVLIRSSLLSLIFVFGAVLIFSHSIAGPLYRFEKAFEELGRGRMDLVVRLRRSDEFQDLAAAFNKAVVSLRSRWERQIPANEGFLRQCEALADAWSRQGDTAKAQALITLCRTARASTPSQ